MGERKRTALFLALAVLAFRTVTARTLDIEKRVEAQRAVERVFWAHRIWPEENPAPKPTPEELLSAAWLRSRVEDSLEMSHALESLWGRTITAADLQEEMKRMAAGSAAPGVLRELFAALGDDPFLIAETLARPIVAERLLREYFKDEELRSEPKRSFESWWSAERDRMSPEGVTPSDGYSLEPIVLDPCAKDTWTTTNDGDVVGKPQARHYHTAIWTGAEMIVWGGRSLAMPNPIFHGDGGRYVPATNSWAAMNSVGAPAARGLHTAVWTGTEMIVWGGVGSGLFNTGARYNPTANTWTATTTTNAPMARAVHTAQWLGTRMVVWGGWAGPSVLNTGGRYDPATNTWTATSTTNAPVARQSATSVRNGGEMIVWGGDDNNLNAFNTGGHYSPVADLWTPTELANVPTARSSHTAVWAGSRMIVWGGADLSGRLNTGGRYDTTGDPPQWTATTTINAPGERSALASVWTGCEMVVWGGYPIPAPLGGRYDPALNRWLPTYVPGEPSIRYSHTAVFTGTEMIVWGGTTGAGDFSSGGRYCACPCPITPFSGMPSIRFATKTQLSWVAVAGATSYDVVRGDLSALRSSGGNFTTSTSVCAGEDLQSPTAPDPAMPSVGSGFWYLARGVDRCSAISGTYDTSSPLQVGSRDAEIALSPNACLP